MRANSTEQFVGRAGTEAQDFQLPGPGKPALPRWVPGPRLGAVDIDVIWSQSPPSRWSQWEEETDQ